MNDKLLRTRNVVVIKYETEVCLVGFNSISNFAI